MSNSKSRQMMHCQIETTIFPRIITRFLKVRVSCTRRIWLPSEDMDCLLKWGIKKHTWDDYEKFKGTLWVAFPDVNNHFTWNYNRIFESENIWHQFSLSSKWRLGLFSIAKDRWPDIKQLQVIQRAVKWSIARLKLPFHSVF